MRKTHELARRPAPCIVESSVVDRALETDRAHATAEYLAEFRTDIESFIPIEVVESCVGDYREQMPASGLRYFGFTDPSGGSADSFTLAISHKRAIASAR